MGVNILADYTENEIDKNESHIVLYTDDVYMAGRIVKEKLESQGYKVQSLIVVNGIYTLDELHDMANYGEKLEEADYQLIYVSNEMVSYLRSIANNPMEARQLQREIEQRKKAGQQNRK